MQQEAVYFGENGIIKSAFHKNKKNTDINEVDVEEIVLSHKKSYGINTLLDTYINLMLFHYYCV